MQQPTTYLTGRQLQFNAIFNMSFHDYNQP